MSTDLQALDALIDAVHDAVTYCEGFDTDWRRELADYGREIGILPVGIEALADEAGGDTDWQSWLASGQGELWEALVDVHAVTPELLPHYINLAGVLEDANRAAERCGFGPVASLRVTRIDENDRDYRVQVTVHDPPPLHFRSGSPMLMELKAEICKHALGSVFHQDARGAAAESLRAWERALRYHLAHEIAKRGWPTDVHVFRLDPESDDELDSENHDPCNGQEPKPLSGKALEVAEYIRRNPGQKGDTIARATSITSESFRRIFATRLRRLGYFNNKPHGYYPPET